MRVAARNFCSLGAQNENALNKKLTFRSYAKQREQPEGHCCKPEVVSPNNPVLPASDVDGVLQPSLDEL
jgi:hypothetical protein